MREGKALDEAMALATGVALDQLPEDRPWEKNRSFFMRDFGEISKELTTEIINKDVENHLNEIEVHFHALYCF